VPQIVFWYLLTSALDISETMHPTRYVNTEH